MITPRHVLPLIAFASSMGFLVSSALGETNSSAKVIVEQTESFFPELKLVLKKIDSQSPTLSQERERLAEAKANRMTADAKSGVRFSIGANAYSLHEDRPGDDFYHRYRFLASASVRKPLYHWGALRAEGRIAELNEVSAKSTYSNLSSDLSARAKTEYLNLVLASYDIELSGRSLDLANAKALEMEDRLRLGLVTELSVSEARTRSLRLRIDLSEKERLLSKGKGTFSEDTGFAEKLDLKLTKEFVNFSSDHSFAKNLPISSGDVSTLAMENLERSIETQRQYVKMAEAELRPKLNLVGGFYQDQVDHLDNRSTQDRNNLIVGVEANWALFDSSLSKGRKLASLARKRRLELELEREIRRQRLEATSTREQLIALAEIIKSSRRLVEAASDRYEKSIIEFEQNRITSETFFTSRLALAHARLSLFRSVANYLNTKDQYGNLLYDSRRAVR